MLHVDESCVCSFFLLWRNPQLLRLTLLTELSPRAGSGPAVEGFQLPGGHGHASSYPMGAPRADLRGGSWGGAGFVKHGPSRLAVSRLAGLFALCSWWQRKPNEFPNLECAKSGLCQVRRRRYAV